LGVVRSSQCPKSKKLNTKGSTEAEMVGAEDIFLAEQGYEA
jgi:hypothetical protein